MVGLDSRCSYSISAFIEDFVGELVPCNVSIDGLTNAAKASFRGTIRWNFEDHQGVVHQVRLPGSLYLPGTGHRLFSPQHWAQTVGIIDENDEGPICKSSGTKAVLFWRGKDGVDTHKVIPLDDKNVFTMPLAPRYKGFIAHCAIQGFDPVKHDQDPTTTEAPPTQGQDPKPEDLNQADLVPNAVDMFDIGVLETNKEHSEGTMDYAKELPSAELL